MTKEKGENYNSKIDGYLASAKSAEREGKWVYAGEFYSLAGNERKARESYLHAGKYFEKEGDLINAAGYYRQAGNKRKARELIAQVKNMSAKGMFNDWYSSFRIKQGGNSRVYHEVQHVKEEYNPSKEKSAFLDLSDKTISSSSIQEMKRLKGKGIDNIVMSVLTFGGLGTIFSFFSKNQLSGTIPSGTQLAPPFPNYLPYVFFFMLIGGIAYFLIKKFSK